MVGCQTVWAAIIRPQMQQPGHRAHWQQALHPSFFQPSRELRASSIASPLTRDLVVAILSLLLARKRSLLVRAREGKSRVRAAAVLQCLRAALAE